MRSLGLGVVSILALAIAPSPVAAKDLPAGGLTVQEVASWVQSQGYKAQIDTDKGGAQYIESASDGNTFYIDLSACTNKRCTGLKFTGGFVSKAFTVQKANDYNRGSAWEVRAYVDNQGAELTMNVDLSPGVTYESLSDHFSQWRDDLAQFHKAVFP